MKKIIIIAAVFMAGALKAQTTVYDTVATGANYANQIWYSLANDEVGSKSKDDWDLAFEITGFNSSVLANTQKTGLAVYATPYTWSQWRQFDTAGYKKWDALHNSDSLWEIGAFNKTGVYNTEDLGWGRYDINTHAINGTRLFLLVLPGNQFKKIGVKSLISGVYTITYAGIDNSDSTTFTMTKANYSGKHFAYYSFSTKTLADREPLNSAWDITFTKYIYNQYPVGNGAFIPYPVTGVLANKGIAIAEVRNTYIPTTNSYNGLAFKSNISEIGSDWKTFTGMSFKITDSLVYFVQDLNEDVWKVVFTGFAGSSTGKYMFNKTRIGNLSVVKINESNKISIYPNPAASGSVLTLISDIRNTNSDVQVNVCNAAGQVLYTAMPESGSFSALQIPMTFEKGIYFVTVTTNGQSLTQKVLIY